MLAPWTVSEIRPQESAVYVAHLAELLQSSFSLIDCLDPVLGFGIAPFE